MNESYKKIYILYMNIRSINAAKRVLLPAFVDFIKIPVEQAYFPLSPCKKVSWADNLGEYCISEFLSSKNTKSLKHRKLKLYYVDKALADLRNTTI